MLVAGSVLLQDTGCTMLWYDCSMGRPSTEVTAYGMHDAMHHEAGGDANLMQLQSAHLPSSFGSHEGVTAHASQHTVDTCMHTGNVQAKHSFKLKT